MTVGECLAQSAAQLSNGPHPDRARLDAETLLLHLTGKNRAWLLAHRDDVFGGCAAIRYARLVQRRLAGEPIQYITGETEFYGLPFRVTHDVLIPRPETEHLVEAAIRIASAGWPRILDVGTGSGAIAVALAKHIPDARITAVDLSRGALDVAEFNAAQNGVAERIRFVEGDLLIPVRGELFEIIVSNPPYVPASDRDSLSVEVRDYEPALALFAGDDGLDVYRRLMPQVFQAVVPGGHVALEIGFGQADLVSALLASEGFSDIQFIPDLQGIPRVVTGERVKG